MSSKKDKHKAIIKIFLASGFILIGCAAPLLTIHYENLYPKWHPALLEAVGLGGLCLLFAQLIFDRFFTD